MTSNEPNGGTIETPKKTNVTALSESIGDAYSTANKQRFDVKSTLTRRGLPTTHFLWNYESIGIYFIGSLVPNPTKMIAFCTLSALNAVFVALENSDIHHFVLPTNTFFHIVHEW